MEKKVKRKNSWLAEDIRESLREADDYRSGKSTKAIIHKARESAAYARPIAGRVQEAMNRECTHKMRRGQVRYSPGGGIERQTFDVR
jgi:hypothetical protein